MGVIVSLEIVAVMLSADRCRQRVKNMPLTKLHGFTHPVDRFDTDVIN
jgi:hypothetical protein